MRRNGSKKKIARFLKERVGEVVTKDQLQEVVGPDVTEWARRLRDLRQEGWKISSNFHRADLRPGQYILEEEPPEPGAYKFEPGISDRLRSEVLERNGYTCQMCGVGVGDTMDNGQPVRLHVGHIVDRDHGGKTAAPNLRALCSQCNQGAKNIAPEPPSHAWLMAQVRRAPESDQRQVLKWLQRKFSESR